MLTKFEISILISLVATKMAYIKDDKFREELLSLMAKLVELRKEAK